jgi:hypothetical protein
MIGEAKHLRRDPFAAALLGDDHPAEFDRRGVQQQATGRDNFAVVERNEVRCLLIKAVDLLRKWHALLFNEDDGPQCHRCVNLGLVVSNFDAERHFATSA